MRVSVACGGELSGAHLGVGLEALPGEGQDFVFACAEGALGLGHDVGLGVLWCGDVMVLKCQKLAEGKTMEEGRSMKRGRQSGATLICTCGERESQMMER